MSIVVSELNIYPIKSCGGIAVREAVVVERGFEYDRRWMVTDRNGMFLTQRNHPKLALAATELSGGRVVLSAPNLDQVQIPLELSEGESIPVEVWKSRVNALRGPREADEWFSTLLGLPCLLVHMPSNALRPVSHASASKTDHIAFSDAFPVLLISEASLDDLNGRLAQPVPMNRFRPNIVVRGCGPYEEDTWKDLRIGSIQFLGPKPCDRCSTTTVDQSTGIRGAEPLRTLATYRNRNGDILFGQNLIHKAHGILRVGDILTPLLQEKYD
ncbi:MAG: MOSC N-terminal beta barrel domain-containing protein [Bacteroidota bacterium]